MEYGCWSDLPHDLLHLVYAKLVGMLQRVRFAAVCTSWRVAAIASRQAAAPPAPWHISAYGGKHDRTARLYCPEDGEALTVRVESKAEIDLILGAHDGDWIAALTRRHVKLVVVNLFSGVEVPISFRQRNFFPLIPRDRPCAIQKVVFSKAPTSSDCILAALTHPPGNVALCIVGRREDDRWIKTQEGAKFDEIAFCNGELYGLTTHGELFRFDMITSKEACATSVVVTPMPSVQYYPPPHIYTFRRPIDLDSTKPRNHLFVLGDKLAMARARWYKFETPSFNVSKLSYDHQGKALKWAEVTSGLGEHALFLGGKCSTAVRVPAGGHGRLERNCIYTDNALKLHNGGRINDHMACGFKVVHASQYGIWLIPPSM